jgi:hypothetical protein
VVTDQLVQGLTRSIAVRALCLFCAFAGVVPAMLGALVLAQLMSAGGQDSPGFIIAYHLTRWMGKGYLAVAGA